MTGLALRRGCAASRAPGPWSRPTRGEEGGDAGFPPTPAAGPPVPKAPLSDQRIVEILGQDDIKIARRTVAKYREMLGILSSSKRKKYF